MPLPIAGAIIAGASISALGGLIQGWMGGNAAENAANAQLRGTRESNELMRGMYEQGRADLAPYRQAGQYGLGEYMRMLQAGSNDGDLLAARDEGMNAIDARAGSRGLQDSSFRGKALGKLQAQTELAREQRRWDRVGALMGVGAQAGAQGAGLAGQAGGQMGSLWAQGTGGAAGLRAQGGGMMAQGVGSAAGAVGSGLAGYGMYQGLRGYQPAQGTWSPAPGTSWVGNTAVTHPVGT